MSPPRGYQRACTAGRECVRCEVSKLSKGYWYAVRSQWGPYFVIEHSTEPVKDTDETGAVRKFYYEPETLAVQGQAAAEWAAELNARDGCKPPPF